MSAKSSYRAIVLKKSNLLHNDLTVTVFTEEKGKMRLFAKGARAFRSRRASHLQTGNLIHVLSSEYHGAHYIDSTDIISAFSLMRTQDKISHVYLYLFVLDRLLAENQQDEVLFSLAIHFFSTLSRSVQNHRAILGTSLFKTLQMLGYRDREDSIERMLSQVEELINEKIPQHGII